LSNIGLQLHGAKSKIFTTMVTNFNFVDIRGEMIEIIAEGSFHKYLGRNLPGYMDDRGPIEVKHRLQSAWHQFHKYQQQLTNKHVSIKLRLKLFDSVVTPCLLFGLGALPLYQHWVLKIDTTHRKMIRRIVGLVRQPNEIWEVTMRRMKLKVGVALRQWDVKPWSKRIASNQWNHGMRISAMDDQRWANLSVKWEPREVDDPSLLKKPARSSGRPYLRWDDNLSKYCEAHFKKKWYDVSGSLMTQHRENYCEFVSNGFDVPFVPYVPLIPVLARNSERNVGNPHFTNRVYVPFRSSNDNWW
jgi:hypothetical protein